MKTTLITSLAFCLLLSSVTAWPASTKDELEVIKATQAEMQKDLAEIKKLLKDGAPARIAPAKAAFREQDVSIGDSPFKGEAKATVTLIEFSDYQCPYCSRHARNVMPQIISDYVDTGKVKYVMFENPIPSLHRNATGASLAALCAGDQGKYWEMHDIMFANQKGLDVDGLKSFAATIGLNSPEFDDCLDSKKFAKQVKDNIATAARVGVSGTPGFIVGLTDNADPGKARVSAYIKGARPFDSFKAEIDKLLDSVN